MVLGSLLKQFGEKDSNGDNIFEDEHWAIQQIQKSLEAQYSDVFDGKQKGLTVIPSRFHYSKDGSLSIGGLESRIAEEKRKMANKESSEYTQQEIKKMESIIHGYEGDAAEHKVLSALTRLWYGKRGLLLHSFKPEHILRTLTTRAKSQRNCSKELKFTKLEDKLSEVLGINTKDETSNIIRKIKQLYPTKNTLTVEELSTLVQNANEEKFKDDEKIKHLKSTFESMSRNLGKSLFTMEEAEELVSIALFHWYLSPAGECDFVSCILDERTIYVIEVKYQRTNNLRAARTLLKEASRQTRRTENFLTQIFAPFFNEDWRMVKLVCVLPGTLDLDSSCNECTNCVITDESINDIEVRLRQMLPPSNSKISISDEEGFLNFFELTVASISTGTYPSVWKTVVGSQAHQPITAGYTKMQSSVIGKGCFNNKKKKKFQNSSQIASNNTISLDDAIHRAHDAGKLLFFSSMQLGLLNTSQILSLLLWGDYGTGK